MRDAQAAREIGSQDQIVDQLYDQVFRELLTYMIEDERSIKRAMHLLFVAHNLERIVKKMYTNKHAEYTTGNVMDLAGLPRVTCSRMLENLAMLNVLRKKEVTAGTGRYVWRFTDDIMEVIEGSELYD